MSPLLIALLVFLATGVAATAWLRRGAVRAPARTRGPGELAELHWREFTRLVLQAMKARGYEPVVEDGGPGDGIPSDASDILLHRGGDRVLLSCKHGSGSIVGAPAILGLGKLAQLRGAQGIVLATPGRFDDEAIRLARQQGGVELLDGAELWPELRPYVGPGHHARDDADAPQAAPEARTLGLAWGGAAVLGAIAWLALPAATPVQPPARVATPAAITVQAAGAGPAASASAPTAAAPVEAPAFEPVPTDPQVLQQRRADTASAISTVFGVDRAVWSTQSTLLVYLATENADPTDALCPLLERYPELAASRVQLQAPQGSERPVRFMQCRAY